MTTNSEVYENIPIYYANIDTWSEISFSSREEFRDKIKSIFKEPGKYEFDSSTKIFNSQATIFNKDGFYCAAPYMSKDFLSYWDNQKAKCRKGVFIVNGTKEWFLSRDYYMWLNFLPIFDKEEKKFGFAKIRDAQYHMALYEIIAELSYKHAVILKKRQIASSYFHIGKLINQYWFEQGAVLKMGASLKDYISDKGSWKFLDEYRNFLNEHTAWYRPNEPDKVLSWQQKIKVRIAGRDTYKGLKSTFSGTSFEKDPTNGVGGPCTYFFHEEAGIAPKMDDTYGYMKPAMKSGMITTGMFIAAGSVGDLSQCGPLKSYMRKPEENGFLGVETDLIDSKGTIGISGLFIPEHWSMPPFIDEFGNSLIEESLKALEEYFAECKKNMEPSAYQLELSQHPRNIEEAFATRQVSVFPPHLLAHQLKRIEDKEYPVEYIDLTRDENGKVEPKLSNKIPIREFPITRDTQDKEGIICVYERPMKDAPWGTYYASIDPVGEGKTTTSDSLCSIIVYKNPIEVTKRDSNGNLTNYIERDKIVATWCGRFDDLKKTHQRLESIIEWYNAWTVVEVNVSLFIEYMISQRKQKYLVTKDQMLFMKDLTNANTYQAYGWKNTGNFFKQHLVSYAIQFLEEELDTDTDSEGNIKKITYGVERIPDPMLLKEMQDYQVGVNVDRLVSFAALVAFATVQQSNRGLAKRVETTDDSMNNSQKMSKLIVSPFRHLGKSGSSMPSFKRSAFRNLK